MTSFLCGTGPLLPVGIPPQDTFSLLILVERRTCGMSRVDRPIGRSNRCVALPLRYPVSCDELFHPFQILDHLAVKPLIFAEPRLPRDGSGRAGNLMVAPINLDK